MRCFIAIELSEAVKSVLSVIEEELKKTGADVRWVKPENIHLTIKFLGNIEEKIKEKIIESLKIVCSKYEHFSVELKGIGMFPNLKSPRVLWVGIGNNEILKGIQEEIDEGMGKAGLERENRKFTAHLTIGRISSLRGKEHLVKAMKTYENKNFEKMNVASISFIRSDLHPEGARYTNIAKIPLGK